MKAQHLQPSERQKRAVDNVISGKFHSKRQALLDAGYDKTVADRPSQVFKSHGVQVYLKTLSKISKKRYSLSLQDKVMLTYLDGLDATKLYGKEGREHPDWMARKQFADSLADLMKFSPENPMNQKNRSGNFNQFNFFSMNERDRQNVNSTFKDFLGKYYKGE